MTNFLQGSVILARRSPASGPAPPLAPLWLKNRRANDARAAISDGGELFQVIG
jgi:hypothetical protein